MKRSLAIFTAFFLLLALASAANQPANAQVAIRQVLDKQVEAWNQHDLEGFMQAYWHSPELTFFSGATVHRGWDAALERYRKAYLSEGRQMGKLAFSDLQIEPVGPAAALVRGSFHLTMPDGKQPHGIFTLVFRKFPQGWRIIHDHTCAAE
jgi:beta-aspartyl-peptidase (threonine type)